MVTMYEVREKYDKAELYDIIEDYVRETGSELGRDILDHFDSYLPKFKKIVPNDYARVIRLIGRYEEQGISHDNAELEAFRRVSESA